MAPRTPPRTVGLILTYNGERLLARCLASLSFCDEIIVVDSLSSDATCDIARAAGATVLERRWEGPGPQFRFALEHIRALEPKVDWVVSLDQDEYLTDELAANIRAAVTREEDLAGYWMPRSSFYFDRFMRHSGWYPDHLLRLFRPARMEVHVSGAHYSFRPLGDTGRLSGDIIHYPYRNFREHLDKINSYAQQGADSLKAKGRPGGVLAGTIHGLARFAKLYLLKLGLLDGRAGFINAVHGAFYAFLKYVRASEREDWGPKP
ncbi:MAG: glycosyltransferase family 2 protein [Proteobacteria bacterium]|nr:glycosyltransferase family 2 protein [Pseudomonadota bacterium]